MHASVALLNPSLFEGWSTTVEEAKAAGVPMVLSDLDVHKEQAGEYAIYFDRHSSFALAETLSKFVVHSKEERDQMREKARTESKRRVSEFAKQFIELVRFAAG
jgi:glycosyltransferase involved in cell wall biosynthesis